MIDQDPDFVTAMGQCFSDNVTPPVPFEDASIHECYNAIWQVLGRAVDADRMARLTPEEVERLAAGFGSYFECPPPSVDQVRRALEDLAFRWPGDVVVPD